MRSRIVFRKVAGVAQFAKLATRTILLAQCKFSGPTALGQAAGATAELSLLDGRTTYYSGEPVRLSITYRQNGSDCYLVGDTVLSRVNGAGVSVLLDNLKSDGIRTGLLSDMEVP